MANTIKTRILGSSGLTVSAVGLGCMGMSDFYGKSDDDQSLAVLEQALDLGVNFYDTADKLGIEQKLQHGWVDGFIDQLWQNDVQGVLQRLQTLFEKTKHDRLRCLINHLKRFAAAVVYGRFQENGWPIGSGEVESAHRYVPQERMKIPGAIWHPDTVNPA